MALIGTISGSYGTSTTAISGSLIIADPSSYLNVTSGTYVPLVSTVSTNAAKIIAGLLRDIVLGAPAGQKVFISGSTVTLNAGAGGISVQRDASEILQFSSPESAQASIVPGAGFTTANLFNTTTTTLNLGGAATTINLGVASGRTTVTGNAEISGSLIVTGSTNVGVVVENLINSVGSTGTVAFDTSKQGIFYVNGPTGTITANFTNVPTTNLRVITPTVILSQSATAYSITVVQIDGTPQTLNWANGTTPTATVGKQDVFGFSLIRSGSAWKVLGQLSTYG